MMSVFRGVLVSRVSLERCPRFRGVLREGFCSILAVTYRCCETCRSVVWNRDVATPRCPAEFGSSYSIHSYSQSLGTHPVIIVGLV